MKNSILTINTSFQKIILPIFILILSVSCHTSQERSTNESPKDTNNLFPNQLETGDILFVGLPMSYSLAPDAQNEPANLNTCAGDSLNLIHVAMIEVEKDTTWIIDATIKHQVARYPIDTFLTDFTLADGSYPLFIVKRLKDNSNAQYYINNAKKYIGKPYDVDFLPDNEAYFCSELVRNSYMTAEGEYLFREYPMNFQKTDGTFPVYWQQLFQYIHKEIPQGKIGTTPAQMSQERCLQTIDCPIY